MAHASFDGLRILSLESRRAKEVEKLIRTYGGEPLVVPAMREVPLQSNRPVFDFVERLLGGEFDLVIFMTGVGIRAILEIAETRHQGEAVVDALRMTRIAVRGSKPQAALRELQVPIAVTAAEPSTWRELMQGLKAEYGEELAGFRVALQEYGASNPDLIAALSEACAEVTKVPVYQWALPEDLGPLRESVSRLIRGDVDVVLFMTAVQLIHLFQVAEEMKCAEELRGALGKLVIVSVGPTTSAELVRYGLVPDMEPSHPKMGFLVNEAAQRAGKLLAEKRNGGAAMQDPPAQSSYRIRRVTASTEMTTGFRDALGPIDFLHEISSRIAAADSFHVVLERIVDFVTTVIPCDSCFIYVAEGNKLVLRASKNPHADLVDHLGLQLGQGITGWVAEHREPVALASNASNDPRFQAFKNVPEDHFEAMLSTPILCASKVVGVINLQHRLSYHHTTYEVRLLSTLGFLVGAEIERARLESENVELADRLETRKAVDRAKGVLQRDLAISEDEAYRRMQRESRQRRKSMREIAEAILLSDDLRRSRPEN